MTDLNNLLPDRDNENNPIYRSLKLLSSQVLQTWRDVKKLNFPKDYFKFSSIVFCGMGGSSYAGRIIKSLYFNTINKPIDIISDYNLPAFADKSTLVILASYSGDTEETLNCARRAIDLDAKIIGICSGGKLAKMLTESNKPVYIFNPRYNPSGQPRLGQGYMIIGQIAILYKLSIISIDDDEIMDLVNALRLSEKKLSLDTEVKVNQAMKIAYLVKNKIVNIIAGDFLNGGLHAIRNQFNETGKHFANYFELPEANHHLLEGLSYPKFIKDSMIFIFLSSRFYQDKIKLRIKLTKEIVEKNQVDSTICKLANDKKLSQLFELIQLFGYTTYYLALIHKENPAEIPWVNYFKEKLNKGG